MEWSPEKRSGTCDRKGAFVHLVGSRKFVLIFHELSMTGTPLAMMELATEFLSCGATISVIVLNKKGGLMPELARRKIKVLEDKTDLSFKTAMKADLIIVGSAVCSSWIGVCHNCGVQVLGMASGGTKETVKHNVSGLLHPLGRLGARVLAKHLQFLLKNVSVRQAMGTKGGEEVEKKYLKKHMNQKFGEVL
ncbi:glycosyl transferase family 1 family [Olea europaea subsp. europaea]|uniref:Glycosyl transferase family 1 family n=1 Tax=Olea europaea subsp. europaea TaxID=158383 RepID=A0A8S0QDZ4_OLEEU|nr:glycosyl transferase family 1 family [Olea europaea subsp. europaea]